MSAPDKIDLLSDDHYYRGGYYFDPADAEKERMRDNIIAVRRGLISILQHETESLTLNLDCDVALETEPTTPEELLGKFDDLMHEFEQIRMKLETRMLELRERERRAGIHNMMKVIPEAELDAQRWSGNA